MPNRTYSPELKAQVIAEWQAGASTWRLEKAYEIPRPTIQGWVNAVQRIAIRVQPQKPYDLRAKGLKLIDGSAAAAENILDLTNNEKWLQRQSAGELAIFYGVIFDKLARLAEGASATQPAELAAGPGEDS